MLILLACTDPSTDTGRRPGGGHTGVVDSEDTGETGETGEDSVQPGVFEEIAELDVPMARWGVHPPNTLKGYPSAWDPVTGRLFVTGMQAPVILSVDPTVGHPDSGITLDVPDHHAPLLAADPARRLLYFVTRDFGGVVAVDLDTMEVVGRNAESEQTGGDVTDNVILEAEVDAATGSLWMVNLRDQRLYATPSGCDGDVIEVEDAGKPSGLALAPEGDRLYFLDNLTHMIIAYTPSTGERRPFASVPPVTYAMMAVADDGALAVAGAEVTVFNPDGTIRWTTPSTRAASDVAVVGDTLVVTLQDPLEAGEPGNMGKVQVYRLSDGSHAEVQARWGAERLEADPDGQRIFVSNSSDGSISVLDAATWTNTGDLSVSNAPDTTVYDPTTDTWFVLDRLGGSRIHAWAGDGTIRDFDGGAWPTELAIDVPRRRLIAPRHFTAAIGVWDLDSGAELPEIPLDVTPSTSDTLGDFDYDAASGLAAVVYPETGSLTLVDVINGTRTWSITDADLADGAAKGAGHALLALDVANNLVYVYQKSPLMIKALSLTDGSLADSVELTDAPLAYTLNGMYLDRQDQRLYVSQAVISVPDLTPIRREEHAYRVLCHIDDHLYAVDADEDDTETLWMLHHKTGAQLDSWELGTTTGMRLESSCDPETRTLAVSSLEGATVTLYSLP